MKKMLKFSIIILALTTAMLGLNISFNPVKAADLNDLRSEQAAQGQSLQDALKAADQKMKEAQGLKSEIDVLNAGIAQIEASIALTSNQIEQTQTEIELTQQQINQKQAELEVQKENLYEAMRVMYETPQE